MGDLLEADAIESYENALKLDPNDQNATESLRNLKRNR